MSVFPKKDFVLFHSSFAYRDAPNISHITLDGKKTACGRKNWVTNEGWDRHVAPDCKTCWKAWNKLSAEEQSNAPEGIAPR